MISPIKYLRQARAELKKATWPKKNEVLISTAMVFIMLIIVMLFLAVVDFGSSQIIKTIIS